MHPIIRSRRKEIEALCRRYHVRRLEVFGSATREDFDPQRSDVDFLVEFESGDFNAFDAYFDLRDGLSALLGRPVDLASPKALDNPYLRGSIDRDREPVYGA